MNQNFVEQKKIQYVVEGFNALHEHMLAIKNVDAAVMKDFMEPYFKKAGYRNTSSLLHKNKKSNKKNKPKSKNILVIHDSGVGDFILMSAAIREMRRIYPDAYITLLMPKASMPMAECCPYIDKLVLCDGTLVSYKIFFQVYQNVIEVAKHLLRRRIDIAFNFGQYPSSQLLSYMSGAKERVDHGWLGNFQADFQAGYIPLDFFSPFSTFSIKESMKGTHDVERYLHILQTYSNVEITNKKSELWISPMDNFIAETSLQNIDGKIYAVAMGGAQKAKHWAPEKFAELMNLILKEESVTFVILGGPSEVEDANKVVSMVDPKHVVDFTNKINYRQSAAILRFCDAYIGNDTGTMHAAAAANLPILCINCFPADVAMTPMSFPRRYYPYGVPSVILQPTHAYPECKSSTKALHITLGCSSEEPHCINLIDPKIALKAFQILKQRVAQKLYEPLYCN